MDIRHKTWSTMLICKNCGSSERVNIRNITDNKKDNLQLCNLCYKHLLSLFQVGFEVTYGVYTSDILYADKVRKVLLSWFLHCSWPTKANGDQFDMLTKKFVSEILTFGQIEVKGKGLEGPWRHDFKNVCVNCGNTYHLHKHHIIYNPEQTAYLCERCHNRITDINTQASIVANTSKKYKPVYTNKIRMILWRWFIKNSWPVNAENIFIKKLSNLFIEDILIKAGVDLPIGEG